MYQLTGDFGNFFKGHFGRFFARSESREQAVRYSQSLLFKAEPKESLPGARSGGGGRPHATKRLLYGASWDETAVLAELQRLIADHFSDEDAIAIAGDICFGKKGDKSVGVQHQFCRQIGKRGNCQLGVFLAYPSSRGSVFVDRRLYLPKEWGADEVRRAEAKIPENVEYRSKPDLAFEMLQNARSHGLPIRWVVGDKPLGDSQDFRDLLRMSGYQYMLQISGGTFVSARRPSPSELGMMPHVDDNMLKITPGVLTEVKSPMPAHEMVASWICWKKWAPQVINLGTEDIQVHEWVAIPVFETHNGRIGPEAWLVAYRQLSQLREIEFFLSNAPPTTPLETFARVTSRHLLFDYLAEEAKDFAGLDDYEVRHWRSWNRHTVLSMIAYAWLVWTRPYSG